MLLLRTTWLLDRLGLLVKINKYPNITNELKLTRKRVASEGAGFVDEENLVRLSGRSRVLVLGWRM